MNLILKISRPILKIFINTGWAAFINSSTHCHAFFLSVSLSEWEWTPRNVFTWPPHIEWAKRPHNSPRIDRFTGHIKWTLNGWLPCTEIERSPDPVLLVLIQNLLSFPTTADCLRQSTWTFFGESGTITLIFKGLPLIISHIRRPFSFYEVNQC